MLYRTALTCLCLALCTSCYPDTDFVRVEPIHYVPPPPAPTPNSTWGWLETSAANATRYRVRVGGLTFDRIVEPSKINGTLNTEAAVSAFASFAEQQVVKAGFCSEAKAPAPPGTRRLIGSQHPTEMWMYVECIK